MAVALLLACLGGCRKGDKADGRTVVTLAINGGDRNEAMYAELIPAFEKAHPDIKIERVDVPSSTLYIKLQVMIAGKCAPDLVPMMTMRLPMFLHRNAFRPLDDLIDQDPPFKQRLYGDKAAGAGPDFFEKPFEGFRLNGKLYGVPYFQNLYALYYNQKIFDDYNKAHPDDQVEYPNASWDRERFMQVAKKLTQDLDGDGQPDIFGTITQNTPFYIICPILRRFGADLFNADHTRCTLDDPKAIAAMQWYFSWADLKGGISPSPLSGDPRSSNALAGPDDAFVSGMIAMWEAEAEWRFELNDKIKSFKWDVAEPPGHRDPATGELRRTCGYECFGISITSTSQHPKEAWKFISFMTSPEGQRIMSRNRVGVPVLKSIFDDPDCFMNGNDPPVSKQVYRKTVEYGEDIPSLRNFQEVEKAITDELDQARLGKVPAAEACRSAAKIANKLLKENLED